MMTTLLLAIGLLIVGVLAAVAVYMQNKVRLMESANQEKERNLQEQLQQQQKKQHDEWNKSIQVLAQGFLEDQVSATEMAIRIGVLLEYLNVDEKTREEYSAFFQLAEATAHIPILDKWKALPTKEKLRYDKERETIENKFNDFVKDAATRIKGKAF